MGRFSSPWDHPIQCGTPSRSKGDEYRCSRTLGERYSHPEVDVDPEVDEVNDEVDEINDEVDEDIRVDLGGLNEKSEGDANKVSRTTGRYIRRSCAASPNTRVSTLRSTTRLGSG